MAAEPKYVCVAPMSAKDVFDNKYKSTMPKVMKAAAEAAVNSSSKLTTDPPKDKNAEGFYVDGTLTSLVKDDTGKEIVLQGEVKLVLATWPKKSMFGFPSASSKLKGANPNKLDGDVQALVKALMDAALDKAIPELEKRAK